MTEQMVDDRPADTIAVRSEPVRRAGDLRAVEIEHIVFDAYTTHRRDLYAFARSLVRDDEAAEDIVGDAFLRLVREARAGRSPDDPRGWLYRVVANLVLSRGRRLATARRFLGRLVDRRTEPSAETHVVESHIRRDLLTALAELPIDAQVAIVMASRRVPGRDIASAIGRSEAATRTLLCRARVRLRDRLEEGSDR